MKRALVFLVLLILPVLLSGTNPTVTVSLVVMNSDGTYPSTAPDTTAEITYSTSLNPNPIRYSPASAYNATTGTISWVVPHNSYLKVGCKAVLGMWPPANYSIGTSNVVLNDLVSGTPPDTISATYVPYSGATKNLDLGSKTFTTTGKGTFGTFRLGTSSTAGYLLMTDALGNGSWTAPPTASGSQAGYLSSSDWTTFNNKLSTESDTLQTVTGRGATCTNEITMDDGAATRYISLVDPTSHPGGYTGKAVISDSTNPEGDTKMYWSLDPVAATVPPHIFTVHGFYTGDLMARTWSGAEYNWYGRLGVLAGTYTSEGYSCLIWPSVPDSKNNHVFYLKTPATLSTVSYYAKWLNGSDVLFALTPDGNAVFKGSIAGTNLSGTNTGDQNEFTTITPTTGDSISPDTTTDTLTISAGTGILVTGDATADSVTIANTAPDQTVAFTNGGITVVTGTYPNFTITSTESDPRLPAHSTAGNILQSSGSAWASVANPDGVTGNEVTDANGTGLTRSGSGTSGDPYKLALNLANANIFTVNQTAPYFIESSRYKASDPCPSGWPGSAVNANDQEFNGESLVSWHWYDATHNPSGGGDATAPTTVNQTSYPGYLYADNGCSASPHLYFAKDFNFADDATIDFSFRITNPGYGGRIGVALLDANGTGYVYYMYGNDYNTQVFRGTVTTWGTPASTTTTNTITAGVQLFRMVRKPTTGEISIASSYDGIIWHLSYAGHTLDAPVRYIAFYGYMPACTASRADTEGMGIDLIRFK